MNNDLFEAIWHLEEIKNLAYRQYKTEYDFIVSNNIVERSEIEHLFDQLLNFIEDDKFSALYWQLINYVEKFDPEVGSFYRRVEEIHCEGH